MGSDEPALILNPSEFTIDPEANPELSNDRIEEENPYTKSQIENENFI